LCEWDPDPRAGGRSRVDHPASRSPRGTAEAGGRGLSLIASQSGTPFHLRTVED